MENRSNHILVGGVVLALIVVTLAFIVWLAGFGSTNDRQFDIYFKQSVEGLRHPAEPLAASSPFGSKVVVASLRYSACPEPHGQKRHTRREAGSQSYGLLTVPRGGRIRLPGYRRDGRDP